MSRSDVLQKMQQNPNGQFLTVWSVKSGNWKNKNTEIINRREIPRRIVTATNRLRQILSSLNCCTVCIIRASVCFSLSRYDQSPPAASSINSSCCITSQRIKAEFVLLWQIKEWTKAWQQISHKHKNSGNILQREGIFYKTGDKSSVIIQ